MDKGKENKYKALGMPYGTANNKLKKILLFEFAGRLNLRNCFRCLKLIESIDDFTIDHRVSWLFSQNPSKNFFDIENIAFSHTLCNNLAAIKTGPREKPSRRGTTVSLCSLCKVEKPLSEFHKNRSKDNGVATECRECRKTR